MPGQSAPEGLERAGRPSGHVLVLRNAAWLMVAQVVAMPLSVTVHAVMARYLGPAEYGNIYLAVTVCSAAFLAVEWGQGAALTAAVARDRSRVGELLGSALAWRAASAAVTYALIVAGSAALGLAPGLGRALAYVALAFAIASLASACHDAIRGFERTDVAAAALVGQQLVAVGAVVPPLLLGAGVRGVLAAQVVGAGVVALATGALLPRLGIRALTVRRGVLLKLLADGLPFLILSAVLLAQTNVNAVLLARLAPSEVVGWHAAASKLVGALIFPANALITALFPVLSRLHVDDRDGFRRTASAALRTAAVLVVPVALGCALFPEVGVAIFSRQSFRPAEDNLRVQAAYVLLVYFTMVLGTCISAAGRQRAWATVQLGCVFAGGALDLWLIPRFQARTGNGGLGVSFSLVGCEFLMLVAGLWLAPRNLLDRALLVSSLRAVGAGAAAALVAWALSGSGPWAAAPVCALAYIGALGLLGGGAELVVVRDLVAARFRRRG